VNQRQKARDFLRKEGHGAAVADVNVGDADKSQIAHIHHNGRPAAAKVHQAYNSGEMHPVDGLVRGHLRNV